VYYTLSSLFPASETMLDRTILDQDTFPDDRSYSGSNGKKDDIRVDESKVA
jgi:hypothetical protein